MVNKSFFNYLENRDNKRKLFLPFGDILLIARFKDLSCRIKFLFGKNTVRTELVLLTICVHSTLPT